MTVFVFGNQDQEEDSVAVKAYKYLKNKVPQIIFRVVDVNCDLPLENNGRIVIMDAVAGISKITLISQKDLDKFILPPRATTHDYDLGFQLRYLKKLGKLKKVTIIGLPMEGKIDYEVLQSILRKLVAQDIQGS